MLGIKENLKIVRRAAFVVGSARSASKEKRRCYRLASIGWGLGARYTKIRVKKTEAENAPANDAEK